MSSLWCFSLSNSCLNDDQKAFTFFIYKASLAQVSEISEERERERKKREREREREKERERERRERERVFSASKQFGLKKWDGGIFGKYLNKCYPDPVTEINSMFEPFIWNLLWNICGSHLSVIYEFSPSKFFLRCKHPFSKEKLTHVLILNL